MSQLLEKASHAGKKFLSFIHEKLQPEQLEDPYPLPEGRFLPSAYAVNDGQERVILCIDHSGSMADEFHPDGSRLEAAKTSSIELVRRKVKIDHQDEVGVVAFSDSACLICPLLPVGEHRSEIIRRIKQIQTECSTYMGKGLQACRKEFQTRRRHAGRTAEHIVLLTDGHASGRPLRTAQSLKKDGVLIDTIGIGEKRSDVDEKLLKKMASVVNGKVRYRFIRDREELVQHFQCLATKIAKVSR